MAKTTRRSGKKKAGSSGSRRRSAAAVRRDTVLTTVETSLTSTGAAPQPPVIVLHGLTASDLLDQYHLPPETVFSRSPFAPQEWPRTAPHPDAPIYEAIEPARVQASHPVPIGYKELVKSLRTNLTEEPAAPVPVYPFAFDWRRSVFDSAAELGAFIREILARCRLMKQYGGNPPSAVDLVGHSTGGMVIAACLAKGHQIEKGKSLVRRVVTMGTAYQGAVDALEKLVSGESDLFGEARDAERVAARVIPAVYQHIPRYPEAFVDESGKAANVFDPTNWQGSVFATVARHLELYSTRTDLKTPGDRARAAFALVSGWLAEGKKLLDAMNGIDPKQALLDKQGPGKHPGWLLIVGADERTRYVAQIKTLNGQRIIECQRAHKEWSPDGPIDPATVESIKLHRMQLGDGTVPIRGAVPDWGTREAVVCVGERDFGALENLGLRTFPSLHAMLPWLNLVHRWTVAFLTDKKAGKAKIWGRPLPDVTVGNWKIPVEGATRKP